ncbi:type II toxin-antitoxin system RelE/ParE family toxin [Polynucleobacter victoriensis]|uniref:RelE toxin of RelE / RelB toxin-antitoxin system n=1 Tax=Polynucleobacter victoriensis TaxID=2049319 RepID=A0A212T3T9_9BURK|nr:type II toxin-antitoxin system RelE/ParE family toxin [Polynucleobacter victoriensis]SNC60679.1 hypothetical protein SAMN06295916_0327 [Polynucleobacter victoriensis]
MRRVLKTRYFSKWMRKTELTDQSLCCAVTEMSLGLFDANLGGHIFKKRIALANKGKRSGARTLIASNLGSKWFFVYGFEKSERANIASNELAALQEIAIDLLSQTHSQIDDAIAHGKLEEICHGQKNKS